MSDVLNDDDAGGFAAEFVLGTLDMPELARAQRMLGSDHSFTAMVKIWERRLGELHLMVEAVEPDPALWQRVWARCVPEGGSGAGAVPPAPVAASAVPVAAAVEASPPAPSAPPPAAEVSPAAPVPEPAPVPEALPAASIDAPPPPIVPMPAPTELAPTQAVQGPEVAPAAVEPPRAAIIPAPVMPSADPRFEIGLPVAAEPTPPPPEPARPPEPTIVLPAADRRPELADRTKRKLRRWRAFGLLMMLLAVSLGGLIAAWRYAPERLPPQFQPLQVLHIQPVGPTARVRPPAPPESQFNE